MVSDFSFVPTTVYIYSCHCDVAYIAMRWKKFVTSKFGIRV